MMEAGHARMNSAYPIMLQLAGKKVVVVGGGRVAERKVNGLLGTGARIVVISPEATGQLQQLATAGVISWHQRTFSKDDCKGAILLFAATNDEEMNQSIRREAGQNQLVTIADDPDGSDFHVPAQMKRGRLTIAVSTGGSSPILAGKIRGQLEQQFDESYEAYLEFLFDSREQILREVKDHSIKRQLLTAIVSQEFLNSENREQDFQRLWNQLVKT